MNEDKLKRRKPVWSAISEFYLDTELSDDDFKRINTIFKQSNYSLQELEDIDFYEVWPILKSNLFSTTGVWSGFDEAWLFQEIMTHTYLKPRKKNLITRIKKQLYKSYLSTCWKKISL